MSYYTSAQRRGEPWAQPLPQYVAPKKPARKIDTETVTLPAHWASALINGDSSGLEPDEDLELLRWQAAHPYYGDALDCSETSELRHYGECFADSVLADCLEYTFPVTFYTSRGYDGIDGNGKAYNGTIHSLIYPAIVKTSPMAHHTAGLSFTASGYGSRIPMDKMVLLCGIWRRVYCTIYSNAGSCWINFRGLRVNVESVL